MSKGRTEFELKIAEFLDVRSRVEKGMGWITCA